jgi:hypothetical protein
MKWHPPEPEAWSVQFYGRAWFHVAENLDMTEGEALPMVLGERFEWVEIWESYDRFTAPTIDQAIETFRLTNPGFTFEIVSVKPLWPKYREAHRARNSRKKAGRRALKGA